MSMFECPTCGHGYFRAVAMKREGKPDYETEFIACSKCKVVIWSPGAEPEEQDAASFAVNLGHGTC